MTACWTKILWCWQCFSVSGEPVCPQNARWRSVRQVHTTQQQEQQCWICPILWGLSVNYTCSIYYKKYWNTCHESEFGQRTKWPWPFEGLCVIWTIPYQTNGFVGMIRSERPKFFILFFRITVQRIKPEPAEHGSVQQKPKGVLKSQINASWTIFKTLIIWIMESWKSWKNLLWNGKI